MAAAGLVLICCAYIHQPLQGVGARQRAVAPRRFVSAAALTGQGDAAAMTASWAHFAKAPGARFRSLTLTAAKIAFTVFRARRLDPSSPTSRAKRAASAERVVNELLRLGPTYIKLGQVASCRPDILAAEYIESLKRLQDDVPADDFETVRVTLEAELRAPIEEAFASFETRPLAAASLGQVHRATLRGGRQVVVKVQRPLLKELYDTDLANIRKVAALADFAGRLRLGRVRSAAEARKWRDFADEAARLLLRELDYRQEAAAQAECRANFAAERWIAVPEVLPALCSSKVLTMEYLPGVKITDVRTQGAAKGLDASLLAARLAHAYLLQFCRDGLFHTDPHPGNLAADGGYPGGRLLLYDFGQCSRIEPAERSGILAVIKAILASDAAGCMRAFDQLGIVSPRANRAKLRATIERNFATGKIGARAGASAADGAAAGGGSSGGEADFLQLSSVYTFIFRALAQMGGVGKSLDPQFEFVGQVAPFVAQMDGGAFLAQAQLERAAARAAEALGLRGLLPLLHQPQTVQRIAQRLEAWEDSGAPLRSAELEQRLERIERQSASQQRLLIALAAVQLALLGTSPLARALALAASLRWLAGLRQLREGR